MSKVAGRHFGGAAAAVGGAGAGFDTVQRNLRGNRLGRFAGEEHLANASTPDGYGMQALVPPITAGSMSGKATGSGAAGGPAILALDALATITGAGSLEALGGLIVNLAATITGSGGISAATMQAFLNLLATISGSGGVTATATGIGNASATLAGTGAATGAATGLGNMGATLRGYGDLTPEGLRDAVWQAIATSNNAPGTMGAVVNAAGSGGVDLNALAAAVWAYATRTLTTSGMPAEQQAQILEIWQRLGLDPATPMTTSPTAITFGTETIAIAEVGADVTLTRAP